MLREIKTRGSSVACCGAGPQPWGGGKDAVGVKKEIPTSPGRHISCWRVKRIARRPSSHGRGSIDSFRDAPQGPVMGVPEGQPARAWQTTMRWRAVEGSCPVKAVHWGQFQNERKMKAPLAGVTIHKTQIRSQIRLDLTAARGLWRLLFARVWARDLQHFHQRPTECCEET